MKTTLESSLKQGAYYRFSTSESTRPPRLTKNLTPLQAVRKTCIYCAVGEVKECDGIHDMWGSMCSLHGMRMGKRVKGVSIVKAIRQHCIWCMSGGKQDVAGCTDKECPSWGYRFGIRPTTARKQGKEV